MRLRLRLSCGTDHYRFPAPVLHGVAVRDRFGNQISARHDGLIDTGADISVIPRHLCDELAMTPIDFARVRGALATPVSRTPVYLVQIDVPDLGSVTVRTVAIDRSNVLLGRDFLLSLKSIVVFGGNGSGFGITRSTLLRRMLLRVAGF